MKKKIFVPQRRKREGKTNYRKRLRLLISGKPRLVVRPTSSSIIVQVVKFQPRGDVVVAAASSASLRKFGWTGSGSNIPSAYLVGFLVGKRAKSAGVSQAVLDTGLLPVVSGSRLYAALKGFIDAGVQVPHTPETLPSDERLQGGHIVKFAQLAAADKQKFKGAFSASAASGNVAKIGEFVASTKKKIEGSS